MTLSIISAIHLVTMYIVPSHPYLIAMRCGRCIAMPVSEMVELRCCYALDKTFTKSVLLVLFEDDEENDDTERTRRMTLRPTRASPFGAATSDAICVGKLSFLTVRQLFQLARLSKMTAVNRYVVARSRAVSYLYPRGTR